MKNILILFFTFCMFFSGSAFSKYKDSEYQGKKPLMEKKYSYNMGFNIMWLKDCGENTKAEQIRKKIKKLSYADYKKVNTGIGNWNTNNKYATGCGKKQEAINWLKQYIKELESKVYKITKSKTKENNNDSKFITKKNDNDSKFITKKNDNKKFIKSLIGNYEGQLIYTDGKKLNISTVIFEDYSNLFGSYKFIDFDGDLIKGKLNDFQISGEWIEAKWIDSYGNGWLKVNYRNKKFQGKWGIIDNGKKVTVGRWTGNKTSKKIISNNVDNSFDNNNSDSDNAKYIFCKDKYGVHRYLKGGNCYDGQTKISEQQFFNNAIYCEKKTGEIYLSEYNYCKSYEKKSNKFQYNKYTNINSSNSSKVENEYFIKIDIIFNKLFYVENRIKTDIKNIEKSNKNIKNNEFYYKNEFENIKKEINKLERDFKYLNVGNLIKKNINKKFIKLENLYNDTYKLINEYTSKYNKYLKSLNNNNDQKYITKKDDNDKKIIGIYFTNANANFRDKPTSYNSKIISTIPKGKSVEVLRIASGYDDWVQIKYNNQVGYIYFPLLTKIKPETKMNSDLENLSIEEMLQSALDNMMNKNYEKAKKILTNIIKEYPENILSGSAHFWLGKIYEFEKNYRMAAITYGEGVQKYPNSIKTVEMFYNLSQVLAKLGRIDEACTTLSLLNSRYKNNKFITMAEESMKKLKCTKDEKISDVLKDLRNENDDKEETIIIEKDEVLSDQELVLVNVYYAELKKLYNLLDMELVTVEDYEKRKKLIISQIINLNLENISIFLNQLLEEKLISVDEFNNLNKSNISKNKDKKDAIQTNIEMSISEMDLVLEQLRSCFNPRAGTNFVGNEMVKIAAKIDKNANVIKNSVQIIATNISKSNPYYKAITESAVATLYNPLCSQLKLPLDKYESWKELKITIDYSWVKN